MSEPPPTCPIPSLDELRRMSAEQFGAFWTTYSALVAYISPVTIRQAIELKKARWVLISCIKPGNILNAGSDSYWFRWRAPFNDWSDETTHAHKRMCSPNVGREDGYLTRQIRWDKPIVQTPRPTISPRKR